MALVWVSPETVAEKIEARREKKIDFKLVDLRLEADYGKMHLPGAVNIPISKLRFLAEARFLKSDEIIFYGYSRQDPAVVNAAVLLGNKGFQHISLMEGGVEEWKGKRE